MRSDREYWLRRCQSTEDYTSKHLLGLPKQFHKSRTSIKNNLTELKLVKETEH